MHIRRERERERERKDVSDVWRHGDTLHRHTQTHKDAHRESSNFRLDHCEQTLCFQALMVMQELYFEGCHVTFG